MNVADWRHSLQSPLRPHYFFFVGTVPRSRPAVVRHVEHLAGAAIVLVENAEAVRRFLVGILSIRVRGPMLNLPGPCGGGRGGTREG